MNEETTQNGVEMEAGRELDARIAEAFFGWTVEWDAEPHPGFDAAVKVWAPGRENEPPEWYSWCADYPTTAASMPTTAPGLAYFSKSTTAAADLIEELRSRGYAVFLGARPDAWEVEIVGPTGLSWRVDDQPTGPLAVSLAARLTLEAR